MGRNRRPRTREGLAIADGVVNGAVAEPKVGRIHTLLARRPQPAVLIVAALEDVPADLGREDVATGPLADARRTTTMVEVTVGQQQARDPPAREM